MTGQHPQPEDTHLHRLCVFDLSQDRQTFDELNDALARTGTWGVILKPHDPPRRAPNREAAIAALARLTAAEDLAHRPASTSPTRPATPKTSPAKSTR